MKEATSLKQSRVIAASPVYYGWVVLAAGTFGMIMTTPGQTVGVSVFLDRIVAELGLSRSLVSLMYTLGTLAGALALPFVGRFIDRRGPRVAVVVISALFALACLWMGFVGGAVTLLVGFTLIRGLGQGALGLVSIHVINIWFVRRRGFAVALAGIGMAAATALFPLLIEFLVTRFDWRQAYMILGGLVAVTILPLGGWLYREQPERFGLRPDGPTATSQETSLNELNYSAAQARRTLTFWLFTLGGVCVSALGTGLIFHHYSIMAAGGLERTAAATMFVSFGFVMAAANFVTGVLMDRVAPRFLLSLMLMFLVAALLLASRVSSPEMVLGYGGVLGIMQGMQGAILAVVYAHYFGRRHIGAIKGLAQTITVAGTALGPLVFALGFDLFGGYGPILALCAVVPALVAVAAPFLKLKRGGKIL
jgi:MFS transporter, OFA family, oxalate/formate antiporter